MSALRIRALIGAAAVIGFGAPLAAAPASSAHACAGAQVLGTPVNPLGCHAPGTSNCLDGGFSSTWVVVCPPLAPFGE